jgi:hypothetical protein
MRITCLFLLLALPTAAAAALVERAQLFRSLLESGQLEAARAMMSSDPRRWWETRESEGIAWKVGAPGPWAAWDEHFRATREIVGWREQERRASVVIRESNDYYRLLERGSLLNEITYFFDEAGKIEGLLIRGVGDRPAGKTEEFRAWARAHAADELEAVMPGGEVDPSDPRRFRALLNRWRIASGREPIPPGSPDADRAAILALHEKAMLAHREGNVELLLADEPDDYVIANRGAVTRPVREERRARLGPYLSSTKFEVYRDRIPPIVRVSDDGSLGWVIVEAEAKGTRRAEDGTESPVEFVSAWIELYEKRDGRWLRTGNVSNFKP